MKIELESQRLPPKCCLYRLQVDNLVETKKMLFLKLTVVKELVPFLFF